MEVQLYTDIEKKSYKTSIVLMISNGKKTFVV